MRDEDEEKHENRAVVIEYRGLYFFDGIRSETLLPHSYPRGYYKGTTHLGVPWLFFDRTCPIRLRIAILIKLATTRSNLGGSIAVFNTL